MMDKKEAIQSVGELLTAFLKSGSTSPNHREEIKAQILDIVLSLVISPEEATENYRRVCKEFLDKVIAVKGMPTATILRGEEDQSVIVSSSGNHIAQNFDGLRPKIISRYDWCIENYRRQSKVYFDDLLRQFLELLTDFLKQVPIGGTKDKEIKSQITEIKAELRDLTKWPQFIYASKLHSFTSEINHIFALAGGAIAVEWYWSRHRCDVQEHEARGGNVYLIRDNLAQEKGFVKAGKNGYYDLITAVGEEIGCMCSAVYKYSPSELPADMVTAKRRKAVGIQTKTFPQEANLSAVPEMGNSGMMSRFMNWLGRRGS